MHARRRFPDSWRQWSSQREVHGASRGFAGSRPSGQLISAQWPALAHTSGLRPAGCWANKSSPPMLILFRRSTLASAVLVSAAFAQPLPAAAAEEKVRFNEQ